ncbi:MAG: Aldehyde dehydrogenase [Pseudomonas sp.]|nr:Aldehyde dehydrogenase [Pseudomonas sp.]
MSISTLTSAGLTRRGFLTTSLLAGGGLMLAIHLPAFGETGTNHSKTLQPNAFITVDTKGHVTVTTPYTEMGQGIFTAVAMLVAEELQVDLKQVTIEQAPANDKLYAHPIFGTQITGGSASIRAAYPKIRKAAATARVLLITAAAEQWKVSPDTLKAEHGQVISASGEKLDYGQLVTAAASLPVPSDVPLKAPASFTVIGKPFHRVDTAGKVNGTAMYGIDVHFPGMLHAAVAASPVFGGKLGKVDDSKALTVKGVHKVIRLEDAVAVVAEHTGAARKGLAALVIEWDEGPNAQVSTQTIADSVVEALKGQGIVSTNKGSFNDALKVEGARQVDYTFHTPNLAHATMEPMNCTVQVTQDQCDVWLGTQAPVRAQAAAMMVTGLPVEKVKVHNHLLGGGFGRRLDVDYVENATRIAMQFKVPVKTTWSREQDMQHDVYRPYFYDEVSAVVDKDGKLTALKHRFAGSSVEARYNPAWLKKGLDTDAVDGAPSTYDFTNHYVEYVAHELPPGMNSGFWRGVGPTHNMAVLETFIDQLASLAKQDPLAYRQAMLQDKPRALAVLNLAAEKAGWGTPSEPGTGRGIAVVGSVSWDAYAASVVDVKVDKNGQVSVVHVTTAIDAGQPINPDGLIAQMQSGHMYGLTAALFGNITLKNGRVEQSNFHDYQIVRMNQAPSMDIHLVTSPENPGGAGEIGTAVIQPALLNAVFAATGKRLQRLPIDAQQLKTV